MSDPHTAFVEQQLGQLLRHPDPLREPAVERALARLQAARGDAAYLLMHRVLVLQAALDQVREAGREGQPVAAAPASPPRRPAAPARGFLRDAAVVAAGVTAGVVAGQAVWQGLSADGAGDALARAAEDLGVDGWL